MEVYNKIIEDSIIVPTGNSDNPVKDSQHITPADWKNCN